jgi:hypothetical protein
MMQRCFYGWIGGRTLSYLLVAVGVVGEFLVDRISGPIIKRRDAAQEAEIARLNKEAGDARKSAAEVEERLAWRWFTPEQESRMVAELSGFKGNHVDIGISPETAEAARFAKQLQKVLARAGWASDIAKSRMDIIAAGVVVRTDSRGIKAGQAILRFFIGERFACSFQEDLPGVGIPGIDPKDAYLARVLIVVGSKP